VLRTRALLTKEQRAELVKRHLWMLWTDYIRPPHFEKYPQLHDLLNRATKAAGVTGGNRIGRPGRRPETARPDRRDRHDFVGNQERQSKHEAIRVVRVANFGLARTTTDDPTKRGNRGKPESLYQRAAAHHDGPDEVAESAPI
jgi:hypothetical protein